MRLFEVSNAGLEGETETEIPDYDSVEVLGIVCTVDLFPIHGRGHSSDQGRTQKQTQRPLSPPPERHLSYPVGVVPPPQYIPPSAAREAHSIPSHHPRTHDTSNTDSTRHLEGRHTIKGEPPDIVHHVDQYPITESSKMTQALVGATFVQPAAVDFQGRKSLMFVFADLAVKTEGRFILRYRVFDIFSRPIGHPERVIQAECYGGVFRVYSTKEFPGLQASTELTKQLARWGVRLNIRETERKRRRRGESRSESPVASTSTTVFSSSTSGSMGLTVNSNPTAGSRASDSVPANDAENDTNGESPCKRPRLSPSHGCTHEGERETEAKID
ncbi:hypothetical protein AX17_001634 [Amanita inopinata Kibby_2008]|nr:hypothetical protein AX17_001634 [Amanita inopinata Kibby_2008]